MIPGKTKLDQRSTDLISEELLMSLVLFAANAAVWGHIIAMPSNLVP